jgi:hypothetical protein
MTDEILFDKVYEYVASKLNLGAAHRTLFAVPVAKVIDRLALPFVDDDAFRAHLRALGFESWLEAAMPRLAEHSGMPIPRRCAAEDFHVVLASLDRPAG